MFRWIDRSRFLGRLLDRFSDLMARQRGVPVIVGILFVSIGILLQLANVFVASSVLEFFGILAYGLGTLIALIGLILVTPLGK